MAQNTKTTLKRRVFVSLNIIFLICGLSVLISGAVFRTEFVDKQDFLRYLILEAGSASLSHTLVTLSDLFISIAFVGFVVSLIGGIGVYYNYRSFLLVYFILVLMLAITTQISTITAWYIGHKDAKSLEESMRNLLVKHYKVYKPNNRVTQAWNYLFYSMECCGVTDYRDFQDPVFWNGTVELSCDNITLYKMVTPIFCCKGLDKFSCPLPFPGNDSWSCAKNPTNETSNFNLGCAPKLEDRLLHWTSLLFIVGLISTVIMIACIAASVVLFLVPDEYEEIESSRFTIQQLLPENEGGWINEAQL